MLIKNQRLFFLVEEARVLSLSAEGIEIVHVFCEQNRVVDALATRVLKCSLGAISLSDMPADVANFFVNV